jgi:ATP-binding cassette subfamily F protein 3
LDENKTVLQVIDDVAVGDVRTRIRDILGAFLFSGDEVDKKVKVLSGGERSRLAMAKLLLEPYNLLVLDEPTNHLDMHSKDVLKNALQNFNGTIIIVSHDREFLDGLVDKVYEFRNKNIKEHLGGIYDFLQKRKLENLRQLEQKAKAKNVVKESKNNDSKEAYLERKELDKKIRKAEKEVHSSEQKIEKLEKEIAEINLKLSDPEQMNHDSSLFSRYEELKKWLEKEMEHWEKYTEKLENLKDDRF